MTRARFIRHLCIALLGSAGLCHGVALANDADAGAGLQALSDADMAAVDAKAGIAIDLDFRINALANGDPIACPTVGSATSCRLALNFAERNGMWIVMKNYRGIIRLSNIWMDAANLPNAWTVQTTNGTVLNPALGGYDPRNKPALQLTAGNWANALAGGASAYNTYLNSSAYNEFTTAINIEKLSGEYNCGASIDNANGIHNSGCSAASPGWETGLTPNHVPGYLRDAVAGSAITLRMADGVVNPNAPAQFRLDGRLQLFGY